MNLGKKLTNTYWSDVPKLLFGLEPYGFNRCSMTNDVELKIRFHIWIAVGVEVVRFHRILKTRIIHGNW